jgi:glycosyltransferase involved in cell wall biosynthesis
MGTYNGERYLAEQLQSLEAQTHDHWRVILSDDSASDATFEIAGQFQLKWGIERLEIRRGARQGFVQNFLSLACDPATHADLYAFADQDDVWMKDKLARAVARMGSDLTSSVPKVYCGRSQLVDARLRPIGLSPRFARAPSFRNALVQSLAGGNTMVFNQSAKNLLEAAGVQQVASHDWWLYQIITGAGGTVDYDLQPMLLYRQHPDAMIGENITFGVRVRRMQHVAGGRLSSWNSMNLAALKRVAHLLTPEHRDLVITFDALRRGNLCQRVQVFSRCGVYRQTWQGTLYLRLAAVFGKI